MPTPTYPTAIATLDDVHDFLQIPSSDTSRDVALQMYLDAATAYVTKVLGPIVPRSFAEVHNGGADVIVVFNPPILTVTSVTEYIGAVAYPLTQAELGADTCQYSFSVDNPDQGIIRRRYTGGFVGLFAGGLGNVQVIYMGGFASIPADAKLALLTDIQGLWNTSQQGGRPDFNGGDSTGAWTAPMNAFPRLANTLTATQRVPAIG
jgi:hypothetical protein